ncbi:TRAFAC clade GTPase domain-containing protein [Acidovorax soli]|jgi:hypothetical protein|uniref:Double-GTPase 1 domain-containing protein n=1 Tax=Acidovorax soli TaxID=592050 RepID=A0A1H4CNN4_9BURK|nr:hypothetical protein [Acidovorax soli]SEA61928.1 hypothetical protein SAMN05421875_1209 [Acidovorax soli]
MNRQDVVVLGLPSSGKTTYLAALRHLMTANEVDVELRLVHLRGEGTEHLHLLVDRWLRAKAQERTTEVKSRTVTMTLREKTGAEFELHFPDMAGESFQRMWEKRECDPSVAAQLRSRGVLLFVHANKYKAPTWVVDEVQQNKALGIAPEPEQPVPWKPEHSATQVQLVDLLQSLQSAPLDAGPRRLAIVLSAWDKAAAEGHAPVTYLDRHFPFLRQYLENGLGEGWTWTVFGVSAQGGEYDEDDKPPREEAQRMRDVDIPSQRIKVVTEGAESHDLTEPLTWLLG